MAAATDLPSPTRRRIVRVVLAAAGVAVVGGLALLVAARAAIVEAALKDRLAALGLREVAFRVARVGLGETQIEDIRLGWALKADRVAVGYGLGDLARGRVRNIDIEDIAFDASGMDEWLGHARRAVPKGEAAPTRAWPAVRLRGGRVVGSFPWGSVEVAVAGELAPNGAATAEFRDGAMRARVAGRPVQFAELAGAIAVDLGDGTTRVALTKGRIEDGRAPALFPTLGIAGEATRKGNALDARAVISAEGSGRVRIEGAMDLARGDIQASAYLDDVSLALADGAVRGASGMVRLERLGPPMALTIRLDKARLAAAGREIALQNMAARASVGLDAQGGAPAVVADIENAVVASADPAMFPPLRLDGRIEWREGTIAFRTGARPAAEAAGRAPIAVEGSHALDAGRGKARVRVPSLALGPGGFQPALMVPGLEAVRNLAGAVAGEAEIAWDERGLDGSGRVEMIDVTLGLAETWIEGMSGAVRFDRLRPPAVASLGAVRARLVSAGLVFEEPSARFRLDVGDAGARLSVERAEARLAGTQFVVKDALFDPAADSQRLGLELRKADLAVLLRALEVEGLRGQGTVSGEAAVAFGNDAVVIERGRLEGEGGGILEFRSEVARRALAGGGEAAELLARALERFHYTRLALTAERTAQGETVLRLNAEGANPDVLQGHPFVINVTLSGNLDKLLRAAVEGYRLSNKALRATVGERR